MDNNVEQEFFKTIMSQDTQITAFLKNGIKLIGKIVKHDEHCFLLQRDQHTQLVYKDAVSTIFPKAIETPSKQS
jgi:host factor-I protein|tara:strand:- start:407 stop:628 length:222 start_codon:yes stop_codon:yes gene_type:complete